MEYGQYGYRRSACNTGVKQKQLLSSSQDICIIPEGQDLRQHYHTVTQIVGTATEGGMTDLYQSREISASRMANQRDKQAVNKSTMHKECMHKDADHEASSRWQTNAQRPMEVFDSPDIQATRNGHTQSKKVATARLRRTLGNSLFSLHTSTKLHGKTHKKPNLTHTTSTRRLLSWLQGVSNTKNTGKVHYDRHDAGMQHHTTSNTASCKLPPPVIKADTSISQGHTSMLC